MFVIGIVFGLTLAVVGFLLFAHYSNWLDDDRNGTRNNEP